MRKVHLYIDGLVQATGFRQYVFRHATVLKLHGYVRNIEGGVEVVAEGEVDAIEKLIDLCKEGPDAAEVTNVTVEEETPQFIYSDFEIRA